MTVKVGEVTGGIDVKLNEGGGLNGTVISAATGKRLKGIEVCALRGRERPEGRCARTGKEGNYKITKLRPGSYTVGFSGTSGGVRYRTQFYDGESGEERADAVDVQTGVIRQGINAGMTTVQTGTSSGTASVLSALSSSRGDVRVTLRCEPTARCSGTLKLFAIVTYRERVDRHAVERLSVVLIGDASFSIRRGARASVRIRLTSTGRRLTRRAGERGLTVRVGGSHVNTRTLVLRRRLT